MACVSPCLFLLSPLALFCLSLFFLPLTANCDWMIKTITEITQSNQAVDVCHMQARGQPGISGGRFSCCPNALEEIRPKTEKLKAESTLWELWEDVRMTLLWQEKQMKSKVCFRSRSVLYFYPSIIFLPAHFWHIFTKLGKPRCLLNWKSGTGSALQKNTRLSETRKKKKRERVCSLNNISFQSACAIFYYISQNWRLKWFQDS